MTARRVIVPPPGEAGAADRQVDEVIARASAPEASEVNAPRHAADSASSVRPTTSEVPPAHAPARVSLIPAGVRRSVTSLIPAARASILSLMPQWKPRWKPWSPSRALGATFGFAAAFGLLVYAAYPRLARYAARFSFAHAAVPAASAAEPVASAAPAEVKEAADAHLNKVGRSPLAGGLLFIPPAFHSQDGAYDLVLHFNGNTDLVEESFGAAKVDTVVVIFNLGVGSGVYEDRFSNVGMIPEVLERVQTTMEKRGLVHPHLRRLALGAWSAGYGGAEKALAQPNVFAKVDAIYLLDALHCGFALDGHSLEIIKIRPFIEFAKLAVEGKKLFFATHTDIDPVLYAGTGPTLDAILKEVGVSREPNEETPTMPVLTSLIGVLPKDKVKPLTPKTQASKGDLIVRGYKGDGPEDHMSHLMQMSETALPVLRDRWSKR